MGAEAAHARRGARVCSLLAVALLGLSLLLMGGAIREAPVALADGGAPNLVYVAGAGVDANDLAILDIGQRKETGHVTVGGQPYGVILSYDSRFAYVTARAANQLAIVDTQAKQVVDMVAVGRAPTAIALDPNPSPTTLYVANSGSHTLSIVNGDTHTLTATIPVGVAPMGVAVASANSGITNSADEEVYVANSGSDTVSVIGVNEQRVIATIPAPGGPLAVTIPSSGGDVAYVTTHAGAVLALSLSAHRLLGTLWQTSGDQLGMMDYDAVTGQVYVPDQTTGQVAILAPASDSGAAAPKFPAEPARTLTYSGAPAAVAITFEGSYGFVAERADGNVAMFDATTHQTLALVAVGGAPTGVVTGAYPPLLSRQSSFYVDIIVLAVIVILMVWAIIMLARASQQQARRQRAAQQQTPPPQTQRRAAQLARRQRAATARANQEKPS